jgi:hypothetical protein
VEASVSRAGGQVHWARDAAECNAIVGGIAGGHGAREGRPIVRDALAESMWIHWRSPVSSANKPLYLVARAEGGLGWRSEVHEHPPWPLDHKVVAEELGPYLANLSPDLLA